MVLLKKPQEAMKNLFIAILATASLGASAQYNESYAEKHQPKIENVSIRRHSQDVFDIKFDESANVDTLQYFCAGANGEYLIETLWFREQDKSAVLDRSFPVSVTPSLFDHQLGYQFILRNRYGHTAYVWRGCSTCRPYGL